MNLKEAIIQEALRQFSVKGYMATSTTSIIEAVGTSKGGLYNHFKNKEQLFSEALSFARQLWRERNLHQVASLKRPLDQLVRILENYRDRYLTDAENLPGGCIFVNLAVELSDQQPDLCKEISQGFIRFKGMIERLLKKEMAEGNLTDTTDISQTVEILFSGLLGACVAYRADRSVINLEFTMNALIDYLLQQRR